MTRFPLIAGIWRSWDATTRLGFVAVIGYFALAIGLYILAPAAR